MLRRTLLNLYSVNSFGISCVLSYRYYCALRWHAACLFYQVALCYNKFGNRQECNVGETARNIIIISEGRTQHATVVRRENSARDFRASAVLFLIWGLNTVG